MKHSRLFIRVALVVSVLAILPATRFLDADSLSGIAAEPLAWGQRLSATQQVQAAWQHANEVGAYHYTSEIVQITWPQPVLENVGLSSTTERMYVEGELEVADETMRMQVWADGGSTVTGENGLQLRVENDRAWGRVGNSAWKELEEDVTGLFAPGRDPLAYLVAAKDIRKLGTETRQLKTQDSKLETQFTRYVFDLDGAAFARYMRDQMEQELVRKGELPAGLRLDVTQVYAEMKGQGEIWLDSDGLPLRLSLSLEFPPQRNERVEAKITTDFSQWGSIDAIAGAEGVYQPLFSGLRSFLSVNPQALLPAWVVAACLGLTALLILYGRSRKLYAALAITVIVSMIVTPLLQSSQVYAWSEKQAAAYAEAEQEQTARQEQQEAEAALYTKDFDPHKPIRNSKFEIRIHTPQSRNPCCRLCALTPCARRTGGKTTTAPTPMVTALATSKKNVAR